MCPTIKDSLHCLYSTRLETLTTLKTDDRPFEKRSYVMSLSHGVVSDHLIALTTLSHLMSFRFCRSQVSCGTIFPFSKVPIPLSHTSVSLPLSLSSTIFLLLCLSLSFLCSHDAFISLSETVQKSTNDLLCTYTPSIDS